MNANTLPSRSRRYSLVFIVLILAAASLACTMQRDFLNFLVPFKPEADQNFKENWAYDQYGVEVAEDEDLIVGDNSESVLEEEQSYGSAENNPPTAAAESAQVPEPESEECGEAGLCVAVYQVDIRSTSNPPDMMVFANAAEHPAPAGFSVIYSEEAGPWYEWIVLREPGQFIQASSPAGYSALGIEFWGDETNGWARVTLDGVEVWRGDTTAYTFDGINYFFYVEVTGIDPGPHTLRAEVLGQPGIAGGDNVPVFYFAYRE